MPSSDQQSASRLDELLVQSVLQFGLRQRLETSPEHVYAEYALTLEEQDLLRRPDERLLDRLGKALQHQQEAAAAQPDAEPAPAPVEAAPAGTEALPDVVLALTLAPYAQTQEEGTSALAYAAWVEPLPPGADPAALPIPPGPKPPGQPLAPLRLVIRVTPLSWQDEQGHLQVGMAAALQQSTNLYVPPMPESAARPEQPPSGRTHVTEPLQQAVSAVRSALPEQRYDRLLHLLHILQAKDASA